MRNHALSVRRTRRLSALFPLAVVVVTTVSTAALACPNCVDPKALNQKAFVSSTMFLSLMPLLAIFGVVFWLYRKARAAEREADSAPLP